MNKGKETKRQSSIRSAIKFAEKEALIDTYSQVIWFSNGMNETPCISRLYSNNLLRDCKEVVAVVIRGWDKYGNVNITLFTDETAIKSFMKDYKIRFSD